MIIFYKHFNMENKLILAALLLLPCSLFSQQESKRWEGAQWIEPAHKVVIYKQDTTMIWRNIRPFGAQVVKITKGDTLVLDHTTTARVIVVDGVVYELRRKFVITSPH
jgi:hypothetical protein